MLLQARGRGAPAALSAIRGEKYPFLMWTSWKIRILPSVTLGGGGIADVLIIVWECLKLGSVSVAFVCEHVWGLKVDLKNLPQPFLTIFFSPLPLFLCF